MKKPVSFWFPFPFLEVFAQAKLRNNYVLPLTRSSVLLNKQTEIINKDFPGTAVTWFNYLVTFITLWVWNNTRSFSAAIWWLHLESSDSYGTTCFQSLYYLLIIVNYSGHLHRVTTLMTLNAVLQAMKGNKEHETRIMSSWNLFVVLSLLLLWVIFHGS